MVDYQSVPHCLTSIDCAMNGECNRSPPTNDPQAPGICECFDGWSGSQCEQLDLIPVIPNTGLQLPNHSSTWGGSVLFRDGYYHMFASELVLDCGLEHWPTNSQVIRAISPSPFGPYEKVEVVLPTFAHDANVMEAPTGEVVLLVTALAGVSPVDCRRESKLTTRSNKVSRPNDSYMLWAPHPEGPWSEPQLVLNSTVWNSDYWEKYDRVAHCDSNLNGIILEDNSFLGLWRRCETKELLTIPHTLFASDWRNASTYQPSIEPLFVLGGSGAEDPSNIWTTITKDIGMAYHAIFHDEQSTRCMLGQCSANGRHAFSLDGHAWRYATTDAYNREVMFQGGTNLTADTRARPHVVLDNAGNLLALTTGLKPNNSSGYVWTLVQPVNREDTVPIRIDMTG